MEREMNKVESKYDLLQWMKVTMAITRLKKEIEDKTKIKSISPNVSRNTEDFRKEAR